jgi:hypothetical protein
MAIDIREVRSIVTGTILNFNLFDGSTMANRRVNIDGSATAKA